MLLRHLIRTTLTDWPIARRGRTSCANVGVPQGTKLLRSQEMSLVWTSLIQCVAHRKGGGGGLQVKAREKGVSVR